MDTYLFSTLHKFARNDMQKMIEMLHLSGPAIFKLVAGEQIADRHVISDIKNTRVDDDSQSTSHKCLGSDSSADEAGTPRVWSRARSRSIDIKCIIKTLQQKRIYSPRSSRQHYLDIGGGDGSITSVVAGIMKPKSSTCLDIGGHRRAAKNVNYVTIDPSTPSLPFDAAQFHIITCFQSLHHVRDANLYIAEIARLLAPGGICIIREHDCARSDMYVNMVLNLFHAIYGEQNNEGDHSTATYYARDDWLAMFRRHGLEYVDIKYPAIYGVGSPFYAAFRRPCAACNI